MPSSPAPAPPPSTSIPVFLLKSPSQPQDSYHDVLSSHADPIFRPHFLPVLTHVFSATALSSLSSLFSSPESFFARYDGLILTSQRAVQALGEALQTKREGAAEKEQGAGSGRGKGQRRAVPHTGTDATGPRNPIVYVVGPATAAAARALLSPPFPELTILGSETGSGAALASYILAARRSSPDNNEAPPPPAKKKPLLFLVGEQRRDVIPKTLQSASLSAEERIPVEERVVYESSTRTQFEGDFARALAELGSDAAE
ncbi:MAG: hypothetical protein LQ340_008028, partial [Diploschistes diacapsis]